MFAWTIARQRVLTQVRHRHLFSTKSALCMLCREQEEDCEHLFFKCLIDIKIWASQGPSDITSISVFWATIPRRRQGHEADRGKRFAVVWAIKLYWASQLDCFILGLYLRMCDLHQTLLLQKNSSSS